MSAPGVLVGGLGGAQAASGGSIIGLVMSGLATHSDT